MRHRIFIAINLPELIKKKLSVQQLKWPELPCRWTAKDNLHITLEFLGYLTSEELFELCGKTQEIADSKEAFTITLRKVCYAPQGKADKAPRMVWAMGDKVKEFNIVPHITLGRIKTWEFKRLELEERPVVDEDIQLSFEVNSIEIMESELKKGGPRYTIIESFPFKN